MAQNTHREAVDADALARAHDNLQATLIGRAAPLPAHSGSDAVDALLVAARACRIEVTPRLLPTVDHAAELPIELLAEELGVTLRRVALSSQSQWWRSDAAAMVAQRDGRWVALVPNRGRMAVVGAHGGPVAIRSASARFDGDVGWQVCPALPDRECGLRDVARVAFAGGGRRDSAIVGACAVGAALLAMVVPLLSGRIVGTLIPSGQSERILASAAVLILVAAATTMLIAVQVLVCQRMVVRIDQRITMALYERIFRLNGQFHRTHQPGELAQRVSSLEAVTVAFSSAIPVVVSSVSVIAGSVFILFGVDALAGLVTLAICAFVALVGLLLLGRLATTARQYNEASLQLTATTSAMLNGISKIRAAQAGDRMYARWLTAYATQQGLARESGNVRIRLGLVAVLPASLVSLAIVALFASGIDQSGLGAFTTMTAAATQVAAGLTGILIAAAVVTPVLPYLRATGPFLAAVPESTSGLAQQPGLLAGGICVRGVSFGYASGLQAGLAERVNVLHDVNVEIEPGAFVAIVGPSGSGKTTLIRMILGMETPDSGTVTFDGQPLEQLNKSAVRRQVGVVPQNAALITGSIIDNILFGCPGGTEADAWRAAELVGLADDIRAMPMGLRTVVSDGAATFSGGQRQRIMLARVVARDPRIVVLDEATSALDNITQAAVADSLANLGATRIVVAHRLSTIRRADKIVVMVNGRVAEQGSFGELVQAGNEFSRLVRLQVLE